MSRFSMILTGLALIQLVAIYFINSAGTETESSKAGATIFVTFDIKEVAEISIENGADSKTLTMKLENGDWVLPSADNFPVKRGKIIKTMLIRTDEEDPTKKITTPGPPGFLDRLLDIEVRSAVVKLEKNHGLMGVGDEKFSRLVVLKSAGGGEIVKFYLARGSSSRSCFIRMAGADEVFETEDMTIWDLSTSTVSWTGRDLNKWNVKDVGSVTVQKSGQPDVVLVHGKDDEDDWAFADAKLGKIDMGQANIIATKICTLAIEDVRGKTQPEDWGFEAPLGRYVIERSGGQRDTFIVGKKLADGDYSGYWEPSSSPMSGYYVSLSAWSIEDAVTLDLDDLKLKDD